MSETMSDGALRRMASILALAVALGLVVVKVWAWVATGSISLLTSAADGLVDVVASTVTFAGVRYAARPVDRGHRYGHGKAEAAADRAHYVTDVAVNIAVLIALLLDHFLGWTRADAIGALAISVYMLWNARGMALQALIQLLDRELDTADRARIEAAVQGCDGVQAVHDIRTRNGGDRVFVEFHVEVDGALSVAEGHAISDRAEKTVQRLFDSADVTAHLEPTGIDDERLDDLVR
jgi:ferrous-iron efflux pump FieF